MSGPSSTSMPAAAAHQHPKIHLLTYHEEDLATFQEALKEYPLPASYSMTYHTGSLRFLDPSVQFDVAVSPANSYGVMDGAYDDMLTKMFSTPEDYYGLTNVVQDTLYAQWRGFAPPGTCTLVPFSFQSYGRPGSESATVPWGCRIIAVCPTMRMPCDARWDREIIYECIWSLLCAVDNWNAACTTDPSQRINSLLMTPLATGVGRVPPQRWAAQLLLALRHYDEACNNKPQWSRLRLGGLLDMSEEIEDTHNI